ncbi:LAO/AO transport system ATPase [Caldalkalibacillus thermarum TA2.A1]|uniref:LAO/AO transport system ATPase n=1 Tax=Caldalkalibacillus thermarum (strain TA2.A1) TaxID=986075 RepID=F5L6Z8_CALTT|nr:methylmalonyl Co-A mutase-associated GTPase MeaB [Caldalkalibacillus thermarum]EGL82886.1 LAO/AO transport system ATPase [Caldalkalibacillus thermarum TA2.A1]
MHPLAERIIQKDVRALARAISYVEDQHPDRLALLKDVHAYQKQSYIIGITGPPGAGKSSLVSELVAFLRRQNLTVGIVAVDPTSPFTGGAILGDRVRMSPHYTDPGVYIRSMGTRGSLGGLARATKEAVRLIAAFGKDVIIIETVGVGQSELDIMHAADSVALVLNPGAGDVVQAFKAGIMEIADLYVINKADLPGAEKMKAEIEHMLDLVKHDAPWRPPIVKTVSTKKEGIAELWQTLADHRRYLVRSGEGQRRQNLRAVAEMLDVLKHQWQVFIKAKQQAPEFLRAKEEIAAGQKDPYTAAEELFSAWLKLKEPDHTTPDG